jgi:hypothetical protein
LGCFAGTTGQLIATGVAYITAIGATIASTKRFPPAKTVAAATAKAIGVVDA